MHDRSSSSSIQFALIFLLTTVVIALSGYLQLNLWVDDPRNLLSDDIIYLWPLWFLLLSLLMFGASAVLSRRHSQAAARLGENAAVICLLYNGINIFLAFMWLLFGGIMSVLVLLYYALPMGMAMVSLYCAWYVQKIGPKPFHRRSKPTQRSTVRPLLVCLAGLLILIMGCLGLNLAITRPPTTYDYPIRWRDTSNSICDHEVTLDFKMPESVPEGYSVFTCSADLLRYLYRNGDGRMSMKVERRELLGLGIVRIVQVQRWHGVTEFHGLLFTCVNTTAICSTTRNNSPLRRPYIISNAVE